MKINIYILDIYLANEIQFKDHFKDKFKLLKKKHAINHKII
jgi:hypothetical protein